MPSVLPDWISDLPMQQQSVLLLACRGPDGIGKFHPCKGVVCAYRAFVLKAAYWGREMKFAEEADTFMTRHIFDSTLLWDHTVRTFFAHVDELPHHAYMHLVHGVQILGYKHPSPMAREIWHQFYLRCCDDAHLNPETEVEMDSRLSDWGRNFWSE